MLNNSNKMKPTAPSKVPGLNVKVSHRASSVLTGSEPQQLSTLLAPTGLLLLGSSGQGGEGGCGAVLATRKGDPATQHSSELSPSVGSNHSTATDKRSKCP